MNIINGIAEHPVVTVAVGISTTAMGIVNNFANEDFPTIKNFAESLPVLHDVLGIIAIVAGIVASCIGIAVQIWKWKRDRHMAREDLKIKHLRQIRLQQEIDEGNDVIR